MAKASEMRLSPYSKICAAGCGRPVVLSHVEPLWFESVAPNFEPKSWHASCRKESVRA